MAKVDNEQDLLLKKRARRRLVGSVVLVIIVIIILPIILDRVPKQQRKEIEIVIPPENSLDKPSTKVSPEVNSLYTEFSTSENVAAETDIPNSGNKINNKDIIVETKQKVEKSSDLLIKSEIKKKEQADKVIKSKRKNEISHNDKKQIVTSKKFVVQSGAFSDLTKARNQLQSLISNGIKKAYTETIKNKNTEVTRVRIGPFSTREAAEKEQKKLKKLGIKGVVLAV